MRVGVIGPQYADSFAANILSSLTSMGHEAFALGPPYPNWRSKAGTVALGMARKISSLDLELQRRLARRAAEMDLDVVINIDVSLFPEVVGELKEPDTKVALWFPDAICNLGRHLPFLAPYDALFFKEPWLVDLSSKLLDIPIHYMPEACNPLWHKPPAGVARQPFVLVAGNVHPFRARLLERMMSEGIPLRIFGHWPRWLKSPSLATVYTSRYITGDEKALEFRSAAAVLNTLHPCEIEGLNCRLFEAAGCGAAVLTEARTGLTNLFTPGEEVIAFSDWEELVDGARWLLDNLEAGQRIGDAAASRAHGEHTYAHRLARIFEVLGL